VIVFESPVSLFGGHTDMEGATVINACYGGTGALFNSAAWAESSAWDPSRPYAVYVAGDVAVYEPGPARPTGGCGAVAVLVGRDAPIRLVPGARASFAEDAYDFYKPGMMSEYPVVDGKLSQVVYTRALDSCYAAFGERLDRADGYEGSPRGLSNRMDHMLFHSPYNKLVQQSLRRMQFLDCVKQVQAGNKLSEEFDGVRDTASACAAAGEAGLAAMEASYTDRALDKALQSLPAVEGSYDRMVAAGARVSQRVGNTYTGAVHANLLSLVSEKKSGLVGSRAGAFSYGSGAIATMFALDFAAEHDPEFSVDRIASTVQLDAMLDARTPATPEEFSEALLQREASYGTSDFTPLGSAEEVPAGAYYLDRVDANWHRHYSRKD
jgi:hydroxymethylglutaryl-CoA synthase